MVGHSPSNPTGRYILKPQRSIAVPISTVRKAEFGDAISYEDIVRVSELMNNNPRSTKVVYNNKRLSKAKNKGDQCEAGKCFVFPPPETEFGIPKFIGDEEAKCELFGKFGSEALVKSGYQKLIRKELNMSSNKVDVTGGDGGNLPHEKPMGKIQHTQPARGNACAASKVQNEILEVEFPLKLSRAPIVLSNDELKGSEIGGKTEMEESTTNGKLIIDNTKDSVAHNLVNTELHVGINPFGNSSPEFGCKITKISKCIPPARCNAAGTKQASGNAEMCGILPNTLMNEIKLKGEAKPIANTANLFMNQGIKNHSSWRKIVTGEVDSNTPPVSASSRSDMKLTYIPQDSGSEIIDLEPDEGAIQRWKMCLVGYFVGAKLPYYDVEYDLFRQWKNLGLKDVSCTDKGFYFLEFTNEKVMDEIMDKGHCYVYGRIMVLKRWHQMLKLNKEAMERIPVWIRFYDLPYEFWSAGNLSKLASRIGRPLYVDQATEKLLRVSYARICVEIDALKELENVIKVRHGDEVVEVLVKYQWLPSRCSTCKVFGHNVTSCPLKTRDTQVTNHVQNKADQQWIIGNQNQWQQARYKDGSQSLKWQCVQRANVGSKLGVKNDGFSYMNQDFIGQKNDVISHASISGNRKLADRKGNLSSIKNIRKNNVKVDCEKNLLRTGNSFEVLNSLYDEGINQASRNSTASQEANRLDKMLNLANKGDEIATGEGVKIVNVTTRFGLDETREKEQSKNRNSEASLNKHVGDIVEASSSVKWDSKCDLNGEDMDLAAQPNSNKISAMERLYHLKRAADLTMCAESHANEAANHEQCSNFDKNQRVEQDVLVTSNVGNKEMLEKEEAIFEAFQMDGEKDEPREGVLGTPLQGNLGLNFSDYPSNMSKKKKKKLIKAAKFASATKKDPH